MRDAPSLGRGGTNVSVQRHLKSDGFQRLDPFSVTSNREPGRAARTAATAVEARGIDSPAEARTPIEPKAYAGRRPVTVRRSPWPVFRRRRGYARARRNRSRFRTRAVGEAMPQAQSADVARHRSSVHGRREAAKPLCEDEQRRRRPPTLGRRECQGTIAMRTAIASKDEASTPTRWSSISCEDLGEHPTARAEHRAAPATAPCRRSCTRAPRYGLTDRMYW